MPAGLELPLPALAGLEAIAIFVDEKELRRRKLMIRRGASAGLKDSIDSDYESSSTDSEGGTARWLATETAVKTKGGRQRVVVVGGRTIGAAMIVATRSLERDCTLLFGWRTWWRTTEGRRRLFEGQV